MNLTLTIPESTQPPITVEVGGTTELTSYAFQVAGLPDYPATFLPAIGSAANQAVAGNDSRLTDARTPTAHKSSHATGGADAMTPSDIGAMANTNAAVNAAIATNAAASRNAANLGRVFAAKDYGATGDGTTDDTNAIQDCLDACSAAGGGIVDMDAGTFVIGYTALPTGPTHSFGVKIHSNTTLRGKGINVTILKSKNGTDNNPVLFGAASVFPYTGVVRNITIRDLTVDGNKANKPAYTGTNMGEDEGVNFYGVEGLQLLNLEIKNCLADAIDLDKTGDLCQNILISGCWIHDNNGHGLHTEADNLLADACLFEGNATDFSRTLPSGFPGMAAVEGGEGTNKIISNCVFRDNAVDVSLASLTVIGCSFENSVGPYSIYADDSPGGRLINCHISTGGGVTSAVYLNFLTTTPSTAIIGCTIGANAGIAIRANRSGPIVIRDCAIQSTFQNVYLTNTNNGYVSISNSSLTVSSTGEAIRVQAAGGGELRNCRITTQGADAGLRLMTNGANWTVTGNHFATANGTAVNAAGPTNNGLTFANNTGNVDLIMSSGSNRIYNNRIRNITLTTADANSSIFLGNEITGTISHTTATFASNTWRRNTGAGCAGIFYGTATLASGTATVTSAAANSARKWALSRQGIGAATALGSLALGTITAQTSFVINALKPADATVETGDASVVHWEILE
jgi:hypothetical protein